jgi:hypothetical protein
LADWISLAINNESGHVLFVTMLAKTLSITLTGVNWTGGVS